MALFRCGGGSGGGTETETVLWTNSSPSSSMASGTQMTLSQSMANFEYIKVKYRYYTGATTYYESARAKVSDLRNTGGSSYPQARYLIISIIKDSNSNAYFRNITRVSDTKMQASNCYVFAGTTTFNGYCVPYQIIGVNFS